MDLSGVTTNQLWFKRKRRSLGKGDDFFMKSERYRENPQRKKAYVGIGF